MVVCAVALGIWGARAQTGDVAHQFGIGQLADGN